MRRFIWDDWMRKSRITSEMERPDEGNPFKTPRYAGKRGRHIAQKLLYEFVETEADRTLKKRLSEDRREKLEVINMSYGDPSRYAGLNAYQGVHRYMRRFLNFEPPSAYSAYEFSGDPHLVGQLRMGSTRREEDYITVPSHVDVYPASGVAGALKLIADSILLPPMDGEQDNVVVPMWTYLSHMAEVVFKRAEVRSCHLVENGQVDLKHMEQLIDSQTQAVILATVGNPLSTAIDHDRYDDMLRLIHSKMMEYDHPIVLIADVIYEHFRRSARGRRLDAVQKALHIGRAEGIDVPVVETSSFSKMFAMAGQRFGFHRTLLTCEPLFAKSEFHPELADIRKAFRIVYDTTLCPVPSLLQKAVGKLYHYINLGLPKEEELAPIAAVLSALQQLTGMAGKGDTHTMMPDAVPEEMVRRLGFDPAVWFTASALSKRTRKIADEDLMRYGVKIVTKDVEKIGERLLEAGMIDKREVEVETDIMADILLAGVVEHNYHLKALLHLGLERWLKDKGMTLQRSDREYLVEHQVAELTRASLEEAAAMSEQLKGVMKDFNLLDESGRVVRDRKLKLVLYRMNPNTKVPPLKTKESGQVDLYKIAENKDWRPIAERCGVPKENVLYEQFKGERRDEVFRRVDKFVRAIEEMRKEGLGVYLHPSYYDENGELVPERINSFYVLFGFERLKNVECQASALIDLCITNREKIVKTTPANIFLAPDVKDLEGSYIRAVALCETSEGDEVLSDKEMEQALRAIRTVAESLTPDDSPGGSDQLKLSLRRAA